MSRKARSGLRKANIHTVMALESQVGELYVRMPFF
jgi:hypothetical protein